MVRNPPARVRAPAPKGRGSKVGCGGGSAGSVTSPPLCGKNLRWTTQALVEKLRTAPSRTSTELCDEVAGDAAAEARARHPGFDVSTVERNTRRRVYDAMKVMSALGVMVKDEAASGVGPGRDTRRVRWRHPRVAGVGRKGEGAGAGSGGASDSTVDPEVTRLEAETAELRARIGRKKAEARRLGEYQAAFESNTGKGSVSDVVKFPFLLVGGVPTSPPPSGEAGGLTLRLEYGPYAPKVYNETDIVRLLHAQRAGMKSKKRPRASGARAPKGVPGKLLGGGVTKVVGSTFVRLVPDAGTNPASDNFAGAKHRRMGDGKPQQAAGVEPADEGTTGESGLLTPLKRRKLSLDDDILPETSPNAFYRAISPATPSGMDSRSLLQGYMTSETLRLTPLGELSNINPGDFASS